MHLVGGNAIASSYIWLLLSKFLLNKSLRHLSFQSLKLNRIQMSSLSFNRDIKLVLYHRAVCGSVIDVTWGAVLLLRATYFRLQRWNYRAIFIQCRINTNQLVRKYKQTVTYQNHVGDCFSESYEFECFMYSLVKSIKYNLSINTVILKSPSKPRSLRYT